jgi:hypothetical protein
VECKNHTLVENFGYISCYISNQIFLRSLLNLTPFELRFGHQPYISHLRPFGCKYFILKCGNLDKLESCSSDGIFLSYTHHGRSYRVLNLETNIVVESYDVTFDETAPDPHDVFKSDDDKEMGESIYHILKFLFQNVNNFP